MSNVRHEGYIAKQLQGTAPQGRPLFDTIVDSAIPSEIEFK